MRLLVTRPAAEAERTAATLRARGHRVTVAPLLRVEALAPAIEAGTSLASWAANWTAILVTSANAAPAISAQERFSALRALPVFAVGARSAKAMREAGFAEVASADGDVRDLARLVAARLKRGARLLYLAGAERSGDLAGDLAAAGFAVDTVVVYRAVAVVTLPGEAADVLTGGVDGVLHFSRRSADAYVNAARASGLGDAALKKSAHYCLSAQVAEPLVEAGATDIRIAPEANEAALIALIPSR